MISACIITYNQKDYITQAIEGALNQIYSGEYEIVIGDDCSTDGTSDICEDFKKKFPHQIRLIQNNTNLGMSENWLNTLKNCRGKYIAICEGDDYWTDSYKLQKQVDFLEANPDYSICSHNAIVSWEDDKGNISKQDEWPGSNHRQVSTIKDLLMFGSGGATCSLLFSAKCIANPVQLFDKIKFTDVIVQIICAQHGKLYYMPEVMGVYRRHPQGVTSVFSNIKIYNEYGVQASKKLNKFLNKKYQYEIDYQLYHYYYPNLLKAYKEAGKKRNYIITKFRRRILQIRYIFK